MTLKKIAFILALCAATLCIGNFAYNLIRYHQNKPVILIAGIFILIFTFSQWRSPKK